MNFSTYRNSLIGYIVLINFYKLAEFPSEILFLNGNEQIKLKIEFIRNSNYIDKNKNKNLKLIIKMIIIKMKLKKKFSSIYESYHNKMNV